MTPNYIVDVNVNGGKIIIHNRIYNYVTILSEIINN